MYKLKYFLKNLGGICANDFENKEAVDFINLRHVSSLSEVRKFYLPLSGTYVSGADYAKLTMNNGDTYYVKENSFNDLYNSLQTI